VYYRLSIAQKCLRNYFFAIPTLFVFVKCVLLSFYCPEVTLNRVSIAQKLLRSDSWTTGDRNIALFLAGSRAACWSLTFLCFALGSSAAATKKRAEAEKKMTRRPMPKSHEHLRYTWASRGWGEHFSMLTK